MSNANSISKIIFNRVGSQPEHQAILMEGAMENRIYDCFHHKSINSTTVRLKNYGNIVPMFNSVFGVVAEQGGQEARCLDAITGMHNVLEINCNTLKGQKVHKDFRKQKNVILEK